MKKGFTLIELMIVIAIIAIIAAIAIPGLLAAQRASNERNASASLKTMASQESDFRGNDRDGNLVNDYWTRDVYALYGLVPLAAVGALPADQAAGVVATNIKLLDVSIAGADGRTDQAAYGNVNFDVGIGAGGGSSKAGYIYRAFGSQHDGAAATTLLNDTDAAIYGACHDRSRFGFAAAPDSLSSGKLLFMINADSTIWKYNLPGTYVVTITNFANGAATDASTSWTGTGQAAATCTFDFTNAVGGASIFPITPGNFLCSKMD